MNFVCFSFFDRTPRRCSLQIGKTGYVLQREAGGNSFLDVCTAGVVATRTLSCSVCAALTARYASERLPLICHEDAFAGALIPDIRLRRRLQAG